MREGDEMSAGERKDMVGSFRERFLPLIVGRRSLLLGLPAQNLGKELR